MQHANEIIITKDANKLLTQEDVELQLKAQNVSLSNNPIDRQSFELFNMIFDASNETIKSLAKSQGLNYPNYKPAIIIPLNYYINLLNEKDKHGDQGIKSHLQTAAKLSMSTVAGTFAGASICPAFFTAPPGLIVCGIAVASGTVKFTDNFYDYIRNTYPEVKDQALKIYNEKTASFKQEIEKLLPGKSTHIEVDRILPDITNKIINNTLPATKAVKDNLSLIKLLTENKGNLNAQDNFGNTALHYAAQEGYIETVKILLNKGTNPNITNKEGRTALDQTITNNNSTPENIKLVEILLEQGADPTIANKYKYTAVSKANDYKKDGFLEPLLKHMASNHQKNINQALDPFGNTALHLAAKNGLLDSIKSLVVAGAQPNITNNEGRTALDLTITNNDSTPKNIKLVEILLEHGADPTIVNKYKYTAISKANDYKKDGFLEPLLKHMASNHQKNINHVLDQFGNTALHLAAKNGLLDSIKSLVVAGAQPNITNNEGNSPLLSTVSDYNISQNRLQAVKILLANGADPYVFNKKGTSALSAATNFSSQYPYAKLILEHITNNDKININQEADNLGNTALHYAAKIEDFNLVKFLLEKGANPNITNIHGETALHATLKHHNSLSADPNFNNMIKLLLKKGTDPNIANNEGNTVIHTVFKWCAPRKDVLNILLDHGANGFIKNNKGLTPLDMKFGVLSDTLLNHHMPGDNSNAGINIPPEESINHLDYLYN
ncbi:ankyrin repeat domain-containing protein [Rickettsiales endosymbiont of Stachyamoeba lipophora]|uniref:ankyrin repeat domain-containing protein n=1 Tax=Rickettsiales endosymbiont of Stachyamoeba lipophora TaxID=2486578 RepID=UPI000F65301C|nr:ankyrin repeat domain-containing protein [Rickettsiales endosymbiont of Stachyamoeba lipophora]AZL15206.1 hypothetical protein EF513_01350 [Rickettsiales endosymbiont of Stachyamoeba lipophora]